MKDETVYFLYLGVMSMCMHVTKNYKKLSALCSEDG